MAKRKYSAMKRNAKIEPAVETLYFTTSLPGNGGDTFYVDFSQMASIVNRRFYRQGINWAVAGVTMYTNANTGVTISKLPNTWVTSNAWEKAFRLWNKQQMDAIEEAGAESAVARFRDFKVFADETHVDKFVAAGQDLNATNLLPEDLTGAAFGTGEWEPAQIVLPNADLDPASGARTEPRENFLHMTGANEHVSGISVSRGIIEGYADSRAFPQSPDPVSPVIASGNNWMRAMFDVGNDNEDITGNATDKNDDLPYPQVNYPGGQIQGPTMQLHALADVTATTVGAQTRLKGGTFPCGLMRIDLNNRTEGTASYAFVVDMVPGSHRGYMCEPMTEM
jgi:hypothetical protein